MTNFILIFICLIAGAVLRRLDRFPSNAPQALNVFVIHLSFPAVVLVQVPLLLSSTSLTSSLLIPVSMGWLQIVSSVIVMSALGARWGWSRATIGALALTAGLGNTSFVGFPLVEALLGAKGLQIAVVADQLGSFLALSTIGLTIGAVFSGSKVTVRDVLTKIVSFPPFIALIAAVVWHVSGTYGPGPAVSTLEKIGATLVPLALVSVGLQLDFKLSVVRRRWCELGCGLVFKLVLVPLVLGILYVSAFGARGLEVHVTLLEAAMAPMITAAIVATQFKLDTEIANLMVGVGIPLSLATVPIWHLLLSHWLGT